MIVYFASRSLDILAMGSTTINSKWCIDGDTYKENVNTGMASLEFNMYYKDSSSRPEAKYIAKEGNYILYKGIMGETAFTIIEVEHDSINNKVYIYAEDAGLDLINEVAPAYLAPVNNQHIEYYITSFGLSDSYQIGINEVSGVTAKLGWDSEQTMAERLQELAAGFGAEIKIRFDVENLFIKAKYIDIYKKRGNDVFMELRLGREIENIVEKRSIANLATALWAVGSEEELASGDQGDPITLYGVSYDDGDIYKLSTDYTLKSRSALKEWGRYKASTGALENHTIRLFNYDTSNKTELLNKTIEELVRVSKPEITYEVSMLYVPNNLGLGDTVRLVDDVGELYLSARLLGIEVSESDDIRNFTFGDYIIKSSGISDRLFKELRGTIQSEVNRSTRYIWVVYADDASGTNMSLSSEGKAYIGIAKNKVTEEESLTDPTLYEWSKIEGEDGSSPVMSLENPDGEGLLWEMTITDAGGNEQSATFSGEEIKDKTLHTETYFNYSAADGAIIGDVESAHVQILPGSTTFFAQNGTTEVAKITNSSVQESSNIQEIVNMSGTRSEIISALSDIVIEGDLDWVPLPIPDPPNPDKYLYIAATFYDTDDYSPVIRDIIWSEGDSDTILIWGPNALFGTLTYDHANSRIRLETSSDLSNCFPSSWTGTTYVFLRLSYACNVESNSVSFGEKNEVEGDDSFAAGRGLKVLGDSQIVLGRYNVPSYIHPFIIGCGENDYSRKNLFAISDDGDVYVFGEPLLGSLLKIVDYTYTYSISANSNVNISGTNFDISTPSGYTPIGVIRATTGSTNVVIRSFFGNGTGSSSVLSVYNESASAISDITAQVTILYAKTSVIAASS